MPRILIWQVTGMTCTSCERLIGEALRDVPGVLETEVSLKRKKAAMRLRDGVEDPDITALNQRLSAHGYCLFPEGCALPGKRDAVRIRLRRAILAMCLVGLVLFLLSPLRKLVPSVSATASFGALFLLGIVASVSTCLASTGGFMLAYSSEVGSKRKTRLMHLGRLVAFVSGGALLGAIGGVLPQGSLIFYGILGLVLGVAFFVVALNLLDLSPSLASLGVSLPTSLYGFADRLRNRPGKVTPFLVGAVTFILPCGFTQTAQALALASGSAVSGALLMFAFALGTLPVLLGITSFATKATLEHRGFRLAMGAFLFFFALGQMDGGLTVLGSPITFATAGRTIVQAASRATTPVTAENIGNAQVVKMDVTSYGYVPNTFTVTRGVPVRWEVNGIDVAGCGSTLVSRPLNISKRLAVGKNVIEFTPYEPGVIPFSCAMGMLRGTFTVI